MTDQQRRFALEYLRDCNATDAAIRAGYTDNRRSAATIGARLLKKVEIRDEISRSMEGIVRDGIADVAEIGEFYTRAMRDPEAPWAARMMAAGALAKRLMIDANEPASVYIVDDIAFGKQLEPDDVVFSINGRPVKAEHMFACLGLDGSGVD